MGKITVSFFAVPVRTAFFLCFIAGTGVCQQKPAAAPDPQDAVAPPPAAEEPAPAAPQPKTEKRVEKLEKKVEKIDKRVSRLEKGGVPSPSAPPVPAAKEQPLAVTFISKKQEMKGENLGMKMVLEFRNMTNYTINGFSGTLVFKAEGAKGVYTRKMSYGHALAPGDTAQIEMYISSDEAKQYLKFMKAKVVNVALVNQKLYE